MGGAPQPIPCSRATVHQTAELDGQECLPANEVTPINEEVRNYLYVDFHTPMYQSSSCCSSIARQGFRYDTVGPSNAQIHNPFSRSPIVVKCDVMRRSVSGNTCEADFSSCDGGACWSSFEGVGTCGIGSLSENALGDRAFTGNLDLYDSAGNLDSSKVSAVAAIEAMDGLATHPYCTLAHAATSCDATTSEWDGYADTSGGGVSCSEGAEGTFRAGTCDPARLDTPSRCRLSVGCPSLNSPPPYTSVTPNRGSDYPLPPMDNTQKAGCQGCRALMRALHAFPCSGRQGEFVRNGEFRICLSACERLYDTCGPPTHRGGMFIQAGFLLNGNASDPTPRFAADYNDPVSMCEALWAPHPQSVWAAEGISLKVVDEDSVSGECVGFERILGSFSFDTQNFIFDYEAIREREGYCATEDPLYNSTDPCGDLQEAQATARRRLNGGSSVARVKKSPMFSLDDVERSKKIADGWPYESGGVPIIIVAASAAIAALVALVLCGLWRCWCSKRSPARNTNKV